MNLSSDLGHQFELLRMLGLTYHGGADVTEVLDLATSVKPGDDEGWYTQLNALAERIRRAGDASLAKGHRRSAAECYLRATIYHMFSDFYLRGDLTDPRIVESGRASRSCLLAAAQDLDHSIERVEVPYEGASLPAYVVKKKGLPAGRRPTFICHSGFDGNKEEAAIFPGMAAADRGYTVIVFDGPGQGEVIRERGWPFRSDWDKVVSPVIDYALTRGDVDPDRLALMGISFGGVLAPLAAAREHRLAALICNGGVYSFHELARRFLMADLMGDRSAHRLALQAACQRNSGLRWAVNHGKFVFKAKDEYEYLDKTRPFEATDAHEIRCPTLVIESEEEQYFAGQPKRLYEKLTCPKTLMFFGKSDSVGTHYQAGGEARGGQMIFDWLDEVMALPTQPG